MADRETVRLTADVVLLASDEAGTLHVLVIQRRWDPYQGLWALPGGHVDPGENTEDAARRELHEETGIRVADSALFEVRAYSAPGRDPRGRYVTFAYAAHLDAMVTPKAGDDAAAVRWMPVCEALAGPSILAFDHDGIVWDVLYQLELPAA